MKLELIATATFGLEAVVKREIDALGYKILKTEDGKVTFMGDERAKGRSNLWLRSADRVRRTIPADKGAAVGGAYTSRRKIYRQRHVGKIKAPQRSRMSENREKGHRGET